MGEALLPLAEHAALCNEQQLITPPHQAAERTGVAHADPITFLQSRRLLQ